MELKEQGRASEGRRSWVCLLFLECQEGIALVKWKKCGCAVKGGHEGPEAAAEGGGGGMEKEWRA